MPAVPSCILDPLREEFLALLPPHVDDHPLGCHRRRIDDAVVFGKLRRCTERRQACVDAYLALAAAIVTIRALLRAAWYRYRWNTRPRSRRIR